MGILSNGLDENECVLANLLILTTVQFIPILPATVSEIRFNIPVSFPSILLCTGPALPIAYAAPLY